MELTVGTAYWEAAVAVVCREMLKDGKADRRWLLDGGAGDSWKLSVETARVGKNQAVAVAANGGAAGDTAPVKKKGTCRRRSWREQMPADWREGPSDCWFLPWAMGLACGVRRWPTGGESDCSREAAAVVAEVPEGACCGCWDHSFPMERGQMAEAD